MKKIFLYITLVLCSLTTQPLFAQNCGCDIQFVDQGAGNCCYDVEIFFNSACAGSNFNLLEINTNVFAPFTGKIASAASSLTGMTVTVNGTDDLASFNSSVNLVNTGTLTSFQKVGEICLIDPADPSTVITTRARLTGNMGEQCESFIERPTPCTSPSNCTANFTWTRTSCLTVQFNGTATGAGPFTYEWDFDCDNIVETSTQNPVWTFPGLGTYNVCLKVTDAAGCMSTTQQQITLRDIVDPVINCPMNTTLNTDPGRCDAAFNPMITAIDDCDPSPVISCVLSGATTGTNANTVYNLGVTTVTCTATDASGNRVTCMFTVTVVDNAPPILISCPGNINAGSVPECDGGKTVTWTPPTANDNCSPVTITSTHRPGDFFPCGTTVVTYTATDAVGNSSRCTFNVVVNCLCGEVVSSLLDCSTTTDAYDFTITLDNLTSAATSNCNVTVSSPQAGMTVTVGSVVWTGNQATVMGTVAYTAPPVPNSITLIATLDCQCPGGSRARCDFPINLPTICCESVFVDNISVCENDALLLIPLGNCNNLYGVNQVRWYIADAPCPPSSWGPAFQVTTGCDPLTLEPFRHSKDICVYAEVFLGPAGGPCTMLTSNVARVTLCEPVGCSLGDQQYCYINTPITPTSMTLSLNPTNPTCRYSIQWYDPFGNLIPGANGLTYQPTQALSFTGAATDCWQDYFYTAEINSICGMENCVSRVRLYNDAAPEGVLFMDPNEPQPFCPGEDATLKYTPACAGDPAMWDWYISLDGTTYNQMPENGTFNPKYNTNRLYQDTWYQVRKTNGVCQEDVVTYMIDVNDPLQITNFTATMNQNSSCDPQSIDLSVAFTPNYPSASSCDYTIHFYRNGMLLHSATQMSSPANFTFSGPVFEGNYYVIIQDNCCPAQRKKSNIESFDPPMEVVVLGPCFRCKSEDVKLTGVVANEPASCTYQWFENGVAIAGETGTMLVVKPSMVGPFEFKVTCPGGCMKSAAFTLLQCGVLVGLPEVDYLDARLYPNPAQTEITLEFDESIGANARLQVIDLNGRLLLDEKVAAGMTQHRMNIASLTDGIYFVKVVQEGVAVWMEKIMKVKE